MRFKHAHRHVSFRHRNSYFGQVVRYSKYSPVDPVFSWKHGMSSSPLGLIRDFRRAFDTNINVDDSYVTILAVANATGDAMAFETRGVNNIIKIVYDVCVVRWRSTRPATCGCSVRKFGTGEAERRQTSCRFAWSEEATGTVYVQNFEDQETIVKDAPFVTRDASSATIVRPYAGNARKF